LGVDLINIPIGIVAVILTAIFLREARPEGRAGFDFPGFFLAALGLGMVLYGLSDASTDGWGSGTILGLLSRAYPAMKVAIS
jgi:hypothetical protein